MQEIRFDDIAALRAHVSEEFGPFGEQVEISQDMINKFAELTGDQQWIHVDVERAKRESPFKQTIAHGFLTLSLLPGSDGSLSCSLVVSLLSALALISFSRALAFALGTNLFLQCLNSFTTNSLALFFWQRLDKRFAGGYLFLALFR